MKLNEIYKSKKQPIISFEVFPPKDDTNNEKKKKLILELKNLIKYKPELLSITYGAGGSTKENSLELVKLTKKELNINIMPHFTCVNASKDSVKQHLSEIEEIGIKNILALRGDKPRDCEITCTDFKYANELVEFIKDNSNLSIGVAGYPEGHIEAENINADINNLKKKIDAGANTIYTQLFFDNDNFFRYIDLIQKSKIETTIIPGILPITSYNQLGKMISMCHAKVPAKLLDTLEKNKDNEQAIKEIGIEFATKQVEELIKYKVDGIHFYILNKSATVSQILDNCLYSISN